MTDRTITEIPSDYDFLEAPRRKRSGARVTIDGRSIDLDSVADAFASKAAEPRRRTKTARVSKKAGKRRRAKTVVARVAQTSGRRSLTKAVVVKRVAIQTGLSQKDAASAVDAVIATIETSLKKGEPVNFTGFGKFHVAERGARQGRNPRTGETMIIAAHRVPQFTAGSGLRRASASATPKSGGSR
jgi:DNA-binding protein HU-beta